MRSVLMCYLRRGCAQGPSADSSAAATAAAVAALALGAPRGAKDDAFAESVAPVSSVFADDLELSLPLGGVQRLTPEVFQLMTPRDVIELYEVRRRGSSRGFRTAWCCRSDCAHDSTLDSMVAPLRLHTRDGLQEPA